MVGEFNARNAAMCVCAARFAGLSDAEIRAGLQSFRGIRRRQQERGTAHGITVIDDFRPSSDGDSRNVCAACVSAMNGRRLWALV
jgi:UDP-N-acetylmuramate: L-alanyl-gamma-D-glutamyl-meso-diaminopimelate ligase